MPRTCLPRRHVRAVLALTIGAASLVGLGQASAAPPVTYAITGVSPAYVEAGVPDAFGITITGKGFTRNTRVTFSACGAGGAGTTGTAVPPATVSATKLVVKPPNCLPGPQSIVIHEVAAPGTTATLRDRFTFLATPEIVEPASPATAITPGTGPWSGGTLASLRVAQLPAKAALQVLFTTDGVTRAVPAKADATDVRKVSFKVPPGLPGSTPKVAVSVFGILSEPVEAQFRYVSTIRTSPSVWVKGAERPTLKIDGAGFTGVPTVTVCGQPAAPVPGKAPTPRTLYVTPPAWADVAAGVHADHGGVCSVQVTVPGTGGGAPETSVITAGSTFTYAAY